ncbi:MAG: HEAT repeat domain-containing protein [Chitinophagaceae bacterium]|nr:HEAT repeat domain-containing protein [Chitinophagaceae bacterium]
MEFVRNVKLFFNEGNSDKTYEIDLCKLGENEYVVNFRYGKRTAALKEGTKTITPVTLSSATLIFDALEKDKRSKGYLGEKEANPGIEFIPPDTDGIAMPEERAILKRLQDAVSGTSSYNTEWKLSRVIWKAGEYRIAAAVPYLVKLIERGDIFQRYSAIWSMGKCAQPSAAPVLRAYYQNKAYAWYLRQTAANALMMTLKGEELTQQLTYFMQALDPAFQNAILNGDETALVQLMHEKVVLPTKREYPLLEDLYLVAAGNSLVKKVLLAFMETLPIEPGYFQHIRHLFKQAELRDDYEMMALFAVRFERQKEMFTSQGAKPGHNYYTHVENLDRYIQPTKELKKPDSQIAYSDKTRNHLRRRVLRNLKTLGTRDDLRYVKLATLLLLNYDENIDTSKSFDTTRYVYTDNRYTAYQTLFPVYHLAVYLNFILYGNNPEMKFNKQGLFWYRGTLVVTQQGSVLRNNPPAKVLSPIEILSSILDKIAKWFSGKKPLVSSAVPVNVIKPQVPEGDAPFAHLWRKSPDDLIHLLINAKINVVSVFAMQQLKDHPGFEKIKQEIAIPVVRGMLSSASGIAQQFGLELATARYDTSAPSAALIAAMNASTLPAARALGLQWTQNNLPLCFGDMDFIMEMMFSNWPEVRSVVKVHLADTFLSLDKARILSGKVIAWLLSLQQASTEKNDTINGGCDILEQHCGQALRQIDMKIIEDLLAGKLQAGKAFAVRLLLIKGDNVDYDGIADTFLKSLLENDFVPVRKAGLCLLSSMSKEELVKRPALMLYSCLSDYTDVRNGIRPVIGKISHQNDQLANWLVSELVPRLMRKETSDALHQDLANLLSNELEAHLHAMDNTTVLRLLYSNYRPAQEFGVMVLEQYIPAASLTIKQVIATGNHELLSVREWCRRFYEQNISRIKFERDEATGLLDAAWDDTRHFAKAFFREHFTKEDWSPESLISIADSVRADVQAFGRELLTSHFEDKDGREYLLKLSQHHNVNMQLFATVYLERYAAGNMDRLEELRPYFYTVLTRVNKARVAKERIFRFLENEAMQSQPFAEYVGHIIAHISGTVSIGDKARCIGIMRSIQTRYTVELPLTVNEFRVRVDIN